MLEIVSEREKREKVEIGRQRDESEKEGYQVIKKKEVGEGEERNKRVMRW